MFYSLQKNLRDFAKRFLPDHIQYKNATLPAKHFRLCGSEFRDDAYYLASAENEAQRLVDHFGLNQGSRVLDVGCGMGRLALGINSRVGEIRNYTGVDIMKRSIEWCEKYIGKNYPNHHFLYLDLSNPLYNPGGQSIGSNFRLPFDDQSFDIIYLYSVFSHMTTEHVRPYLKEFRRLLSANGGIFLTTFIEENVPDMTENPENYRMKWTSPLHCVRYDKTFFEHLLVENGLELRKFVYEKETDGQSGLYIFPK